MELKKCIAYCESCKEKTKFEYIGNVKELRLYNCQKCHTTRAFQNPSKLEVKL